ncbi:DUF4826 family protein [Rheinheimera sp.]|uniref:DUF4826 family protein n=1 Tax=Rheinheimera sp. TaxID=1869214 RepID=UPI002FDD8C0C
MTSNNQQQPQAFTEDQINEWVRQQFQKANLHLAEQGIVMDNVAVQESRYLPPYVAVWKINALNRQGYWAISGDLPTDYLEASGAIDAREALRAFSLRWQMKAQQLMNAGVQDQTTADYIQLLISRAHSLYDLFESENLWG